MAVPNVYLDPLIASPALSLFNSPSTRFLYQARLFVSTSSFPWSEARCIHSLHSPFLKHLDRCCQTFTSHHKPVMTSVNQVFDRIENKQNYQDKNIPAAKMTNQQGPKPNLDRYVVIHVATTCDEHGVYVTKDSAEVIELGWILLDAKSCEEVRREPENALAV